VLDFKRLRWVLFSLAIICSSLSMHPELVKNPRFAPLLAFSKDMQESFVIFSMKSINKYQGE